ncbi:MAG: internalization-related competence protein ComEC/Rec2, partial [Clostridia bacterium]|nr:internalization-related competence protein ComEC/Rec2 [Clostridia bacterium]
LLGSNPLLIHDPSFIISFACIYSICLFHQPLNNWMHFMPSWMRSSLALSIAVWIGITPVLVYYFNYISIINIFLNVLAVPIVFLITLAGFVAVVLGIFLPSLALFIFAASYYLLKLLYFISEKALLLPFTGFHIPTLPEYINFLYYLVPLMMVEDFWKYRSLGFKRGYKAAIIVGVCVVMITNMMPSRYLKLYFIDVGQGDCSVIRTPDHKVILVDGGGSSDWQKNSYDIGKQVTVPALLHIGVWQVDTVIVSHIHDDHLGGVLSILDAYKVGQVILPASDRYGEGEFTSENLEKLQELCSNKNIPLRHLQANDSIITNKLSLKILSPQKPYIQNTDSDVNNNSLVFKLTYKDFDALFTGDIQQEAEQTLLQKDIQCDVLKIAHHGSPYSSMEGFVELTDPELSIISVGKNNYGHPSKEVIGRLEKAGSLVYRTDAQGAVMLSTEGKKIKIKTVR